MKIGDRVRINETETLFVGCEGVIVEIDGNDFVIELYKGNHKLTAEEASEYLIYCVESELELLPTPRFVRLDVKKLRETKNTKIISTEESLKDVDPFFNDKE